MQSRKYDWAGLRFSRGSAPGCEPELPEPHATVPLSPHGDQPRSSQSATAARSIIYLGMDVHKESITVAVLPSMAKAATRVERLPNDLTKLKRFLDRLARDSELRACHEASGAGYVLHRALR